MTQSYFFCLHPLHLKPQHSFSKSIKPNTKYRLMLFKGIQKCDQMKQQIKSKIVGGKIDLQSAETKMLFSVQSFLVGKNVQFTLKLYQQKPNEEEKQVGSCIILAQEYIQCFRNQHKTFFTVDKKLREDLSISFDLFIQKSKYSLTDAMKKAENLVNHQLNNNNEEFASENRSQSNQSKKLNREGDQFISPRKRIERKSGHQGKLRSRNNSRSDTQLSPEGSVASSRRKWKKSPPSKQGQHFIHSPKKASPPKLTETKKEKSLPKNQPYLQQSLEAKIQQSSPKNRSYQPTNNLKFTNTKQIFDIRVERNNSPQKNLLIQSKNNNTSKIINTKTNENIKVNNDRNKISSHEKVVQNQIEKSGSKEILQSKDKIDGSKMNLKKTVSIEIQNQTKDGQQKQKNQNIQVKNKPVSQNKIDGQKKHNQEAKVAQKDIQQRKKQIVYAIFLIVSIFLIYHAMMPTRKV